jgi:hypothetical protein
MPEQIGFDGPGSGDEFDRLRAIRRIDQSWRNLARRGMSPAGMGYPGVPRDSPAGDVLGAGERAVDQAGNYLSMLGAGASEFMPSKLLKNFTGGVEGVVSDVAGTVSDFGKYAVTPRSSYRKAAFVGVNDPRSTHGSPNPPPPQESPPTTAQALDAIEPGGSAKVAPQDAARQIDRAPLMVAMGGEPLRAYDPDTSPDIGAPGRGGFVQPDMESLPVGQRPPSYFEAMQKQRAIDMAQPAEGPLGAAGYSREDALPYLGAAYAQDTQTKRSLAVERERAAQARLSEQEREQRNNAVVSAIRKELDGYRKALPNFINSVNAGAVINTPKGPVDTGTYSPEQKAKVISDAQARLEDAERTAREKIEDQQAAAGIGARLSSGQMYDRSGW